MRLNLVLFLLVGISCAFCQSQVISVIWANDQQSLEVVNGQQKNALVWASFIDNTTTDGWGYLDISMNPNHPNATDNTILYAAGVAEGYLTGDLVKTHFSNVWGEYCTDQEEYCKTLNQYLTKQTRYLNAMSRTQKTDIYWQQIAFQLKQLKGLDDAVNKQKFNPNGRYTAPTNISFINWEGDILDLEGALKRPVNKHSLSTIEPCSALVKVTADDVLVSHVAWYHYKAMLRIQKKYTLLGNVMSMSSYPGKLNSLDDFYINSNGLVVTETTNSVFNNDLWKLITPHSVPSWMRAMAANRIAKTALQWVALFSKENSGTYNNQWMIIDYNYINGSSVGEGALYVLEQVPGYIDFADMSMYLKFNKFWSSFNIPYFNDIYTMSGYPAQAAKYGDYFTHDNCSRGKIFSRDANKVKDMDSLINLMRYNDYQHEPASRCNCSPPYNPTYSISSRYDLIDINGKYDIPSASKRAPSGAIDCKATSGKLHKSYEFVAVNGPTNVQQPTFSWSLSGFNDIPKGVPDKYDFPHVHHKWNQW